MSRIGRRPGKPQTRETILDVARAKFAASGYDRTSLRDIAGAAGVDPALIRHHFGNKANLFRATMGWPLAPEQIVARMTDGPASDIGGRLTDVFFEAWERADSRAALLAILRGSATHEESAILVRQYIHTQVYPQVIEAIRGPDADIRADLAMAQLVGVAYLRYLLQVEPIASLPLEELKRRVAPVITIHLTTSRSSRPKR